MAFNKFRVLLLLRIILLGIVLLGSFFFVFRLRLVLPGIGAAGLAVYLVYGLMRYLEKSHRQLSRLFDSILQSDYTSSFSSLEPVSGRDDLKEQLLLVRDRFLALRSEKEIQFQYLQIVVQHIGIGLLAFSAKGVVVLINDAAKRLLNVVHLRDLNMLEKLNAPLAKMIQELAPGKDALFRMVSAGQPAVLSIRAAEYRLQEESFKLVSIQDIQREIAREQMARELEIARHVQRALLPREDPTVPGFDIAGICIPAQEVGGDYFDFIALPDNKMAIVIADVSGKGVPAAFYMTLTKGYMQSLVSGIVQPTETLSRVNELLQNTLEKQSFITMLMVVLDTVTRRIVCARAGHNPGIHFSPPQKKLTWIKPEGVALGIRQNPQFRRLLGESAIDLQTGDWLIFFTDGICDAANDEGEAFSPQRIVQVIEENPARSAREMGSAIVAAVERFAGSQAPRDDMTIVAIKAL